MLRNRQVPRERSLGVVRPDLLAELHPTHNQGLDPYTTGASSNRKVWWHCAQCGQEWQATPGNRHAGSGCPQCAKQRTGAAASLRNRQVPRTRSLGALRPDLLAEWHPTRNQDLDPYEIAAHAGLRVWWRCQDCGHEWDARPSSRMGCPACANRRRGASSRERSLGARRPDLLTEWHLTRNGDLDPYTIGLYSARKLWWSCPACGQAFQATPSTRSKSKGGCRSCAARRGALARSAA